MSGEKKGALFRRIRLLRKKLQQIENLKLHSRPLNHEETIKVSRENEFRSQLGILRSEYESIESDEESEITDIPAESQQLESTASKNPDIEHAPHIPSNMSNTEMETEDISSTTSETDSQTKVAVTHHNTTSQLPMNTKSGDSVVLSQTAPAEGQTNSPKKSATKEKVKPKSIHKASPVVDPLTARRKVMCDTHFSILQIGDGDNNHTDLVLGVDIDEHYIVSCSRDTTVKLWDTPTGDFVKNFGGHTESVNCVKFALLGGEVREQRLISGGEDCTLKIWDIQSGCEVNSIYTYNPVSCITLLGDESQYLAVGMGGGKLRLYNLKDMFTCAESVLDTDRITCIHCEDNRLAVGCSDGTVAVLELLDDFTHMRCIYRLEDHYFSGEMVTSVRIRGAEILTSVKDQPNLSIVNWKRNTVTDIANHHSGFGVTDSIVSVSSRADSQSVLLATGFDIDQGCGFINLWSADLGKYVYLCTLHDTDVNRILSMCAAYLPRLNKSGGDNGELLNIVTGGRQLILWRQDVSKSSDSVRPSTLKLKLYNKEDYDDITTSEDEPDTATVKPYSTTVSPSTIQGTAYSIHSETGVRHGKSHAAVFYMLFSLAVFIIPVLAWYLAQQ